MLKELVASAGSALRDRLSSPIFGTFAISWCVWNSPMIFIVLFGSGVDERMVLVNKYVHYSWWSTWGNGLVLPLTTTVLYIFVYPYVKKYVYTFLKERENELHESRTRLENMRRLTIEESIALRQEMKDIEKKHIDTIADMATTISSLKEGRKVVGDDIRPTDIADYSSIGHIIRMMRMNVNGLIKTKTAYAGTSALKGELMVDTLEKLQHYGMVELTDNEYRLTDRGRKLAATYYD